MSSINKIQLPDGIEYEINDVRISSNETPATQEWVDNQNYITLTEIPAASETTDGLMSADDKSKLDKLMTEPALTLTFSSKPTEELPWITDGAIVVWENDTACKIYGIAEIQTNYPGATEASPLLTSVEFGSCVTSIGSYAFSGCSSLTSVVIPDSVTSIGYSAFDGCSSLISISIPDGVASIGESAFRNCSSLTSVNILGSTTNIGYLAFENCSALKTVVLNTIVPSDTSYYGAPFPATIEELIVPAESVNAYQTATGEYDTAGWSALSDKITAVATQAWVLKQDSDGLPKLTTQTVAIADLDAGVYLWDYNGEKTLDYISETKQIYKNPILLQISSNGDTQKDFYLFDNEFGADDNNAQLIWGAVESSMSEGWCWERRLKDIPIGYDDGSLELNSEEQISFVSRNIGLISKDGIEINAGENDDTYFYISPNGVDVTANNGSINFKTHRYEEEANDPSNISFSANDNISFYSEYGDIVFETTTTFESDVHFEGDATFNNGLTLNGSLSLADNGMISATEDRLDIYKGSGSMWIGTEEGGHIEITDDNFSIESYSNLNVIAENGSICVKGDVDFTNTTITGLNASNTGVVSGPISNGNLVEWSDEHQALIDSNIDISNYIDPAVPGVKIGAWTDEMLAGTVDLSSQKFVFDTSILTSAQLSTTVFSTTGGYQLAGSISQLDQYTYLILSYLVNPDGSTTTVGGVTLKSFSSTKQWVWDESTVVQRADGLYEFTLPADFGTIIPETVTVTATDLQAFSYITHNMSELIGDALLLNGALISPPEASGTLATQEWVQAQGYGDNIEITADAINNALVGQNLVASTLGTTQGIIAVGVAGQIKENSDNVPYVTIDSGTGGALDVTSDGAYFNEKLLATQEWVESQGFGGAIDTTADYNWAGDHTFEGSIAVEGSIDFTSATITGLPTFSFDEATGTLTIIAPTNN